MTARERVLLIEDSRLFASILIRRIQAGGIFDYRHATTYEEACQAVQEGPYAAALVDLTLPDAPDGEIVGRIAGLDCPAIIFTTQYSEQLRETVWQHGVADYVIKDSPQSVDYIMELLERLQRNRTTKALVVEDSTTMRLHISRLLQVHRFQVLEAESGTQALRVIKENPDIRLVISDYIMDGMDGFELTKRIRESHKKQDLAVIGLSASNAPEISAKFIKLGANDFLRKPIITEEFYCRVNLCMEMLDNIRAIREASITDELTGLYNRRYMFESGAAMLSDARRSERPFAVAMMDIDHFKQVNDRYGHAAGDEVLRQVAACLRRNTRGSDLLARIGGEEFCIIAPGLGREETLEVFERHRREVEALRVTTATDIITVTLSVGVHTRTEESLSGMLARSDDLLYEAKRSGRNRTVLTPGD